MVHRVFFCVCKILGYEDNSWPGCREMMSSDTFLREIVLLDPSQVPMDDIDCVRNELMERNFAPERIRRHSLFAANMLTWCIKVVQQFDFITAGIKPPSGAHERNGGYVELHKGREVVSVVPRKLTLGQGLEVSRVMGKTPMKKPVTAPLYERNDVGPARANVPRLNRIDVRANTEDGSSIRGRNTYRSNNNKNSRRSNRSSRGKSGQDKRSSVRVNSRMTNRSSVNSSRGNDGGDLDKW